MKYVSSILSIAMLFSSVSFASQEITREESSSYIKVGDASFGGTGVPNIGDEKLSKEVDKKCDTLGGVKASDCYYVIVGKSGNETNHQEINVEIFKK